MVFDEFAVLKRVVESLDPITVNGKDWTPQYGFGSHTDLLSWLNHKRKEGAGPYPLVWVEAPVTLNGSPFASGDFTIILATLTTKDLSNLERMTVTMGDTLIPLANGLIEGLYEDSSLLSIDEEDVRQTKHFNYDTNAETEASDVWDAIRLELTLSFNIKCI